MRHLRSRAWLTATLAAPVLLGGLALAPAVAQAAVRPAATGVTWHKLTVINGWVSAQSTYSTGGPSYAVANGIVYLSGSILRASGHKVFFGVLPAAARPAHNIWTTVYTLDSTTGTLEIEPNGKLFAFGTSAPGFMSLAAVSYPASTTPSTPITLQHGWFSEQGQFNSGDPAYTVSNGIVYLSGSLATSGTRTIFGVLPKAARPQNTEYITAYTFGGTFGTLQIQPNGTMRAYAGSSTSFTSLAGISFPAASIGLVKLHLLNGWVSDQSVYNTGDPAYTVRHGVVYLAGSLATSGSINSFAVLPPAARPSHLLYIKMYTNASTVGVIFITPSGDIEASGLTPGDSRLFTSLASISYPLKS